MPARPKLLFLSGLFPLPVRSGLQQRTMHLLRGLATRFDITLFTHAAQPGCDDHVATLRGICRRVVPVVPANKRGGFQRIAYRARYWTRHLLRGESSDRFYNTVSNVVRAVEGELRRTRYDVHFCMYWFWPAAVFRSTAYRVIDANDVQSERQRDLLAHSRHPLDRLMRRRLLRVYERQESEALRRVDLVVAITAHDREVLSRMAGGGPDMIVVPTGVDTEYYSPTGASAEPNHIVFYGAMANPMNRDAAHYLARRIVPQIRRRGIDVRVTLLGSAPPPDIVELGRLDARTTVTGFVEDVRMPLTSASVVVCPLRFASGFRGRVFEVMSLAVPVVATPVAVRGMGLEDGDGLLLAETPEAFADAVVRVLVDPHLRARLGARGRELAVERMSIAATFGRLADDLARRVGPRSEGEATRSEVL